VLNKITRGRIMEITVLSVRNQATIPLKIREFLKVKKGDKIAFDVVGEFVQLRKMHDYNPKYLKHMDTIFTDWNDSGDCVYDCL
jgi:bifunctional DNA-binding transcriptional regulator/antitoxin component of YhaV-PrlF toxin-antitoxin module